MRSISFSAVGLSGFGARVMNQGAETEVPEDINCVKNGNGVSTVRPTRRSTVASQGSPAGYGA